MEKPAQQETKPTEEEEGRSARGYFADEDIVGKLVDMVLPAQRQKRVRSMARTDAHSPAVKTLYLAYTKDVHDFSVPYVQCKKDPRDEEDAGAWSLELPPATTELHVVLVPRIHGFGVHTLRPCLTLQGPTVLSHGCFLLTGLLLPSLEDLHIAQCTLAASVDITSDALPWLKHLDITKSVGRLLVLVQQGDVW
ncbi:hypothetical protein HU200_043141 [Digitaria exilis]|uniref:Uncharacterized protein n=1 Tax=Digitaria exilis TaxID=1010633 RepID=A0A835B5C1_9POAL|nr:hypothetical protein HU200_043141 [Digitaria exilis]